MEWRDRRFREIDDKGGRGGEETRREEGKRGRKGKEGGRERREGGMDGERDEERWMRQIFIQINKYDA